MKNNLDKVIIEKPNHDVTIQDIEDARYFHHLKITLNKDDSINIEKLKASLSKKRPLK